MSALQRVLVDVGFAKSTGRCQPCKVLVGWPFKSAWSYIAFEGLWGPRDAEAETEGQRLADAEAESQRSESKRGPEPKSGGPRPAGSGPELEDK